MSATFEAVALRGRAERRNRNKAVWSYLAIVLFVLFSAGLLAVHAGSILNIAYPVLAVALAGILFAYNRSAYFAFAWWVWIFSPEVRRLVDFQTHFHNISPVMVSALLVTGFTILGIMRRPRILLRRPIVPFSLLLLVTFLAFLIGSLTNGFLPAAYEWGTWLEPLCLGLFLINDRANAQANKSALVQAILIGLIVIAGYGVYQFFYLPGWDAAWLLNSKLNSAGRAFAGQVRIWGTLNDYGIFANVLIASLVIAMVSKGWLRFIGGAFALPALALSQNRTAWGALVIASIIVFSRLGGKARIRLTLLAVVVIAAAVPVLSVGPVATIVTKRFNTLSNVQQDHSGLARQNLYRTAFQQALLNPTGTGFGAIGVAAKLTTGQNADFDSGLLAIPMTFGWVGGLIFLWSLATIGFRVLSNYLQTKDRITVAGCGIFIGMLAELIFGQVFANAAGVILWMAAAFALLPSQPEMQRRPLR